MGNVLLLTTVLFPLFAAFFGFLVKQKSIKTYAIAAAFVELILSLALWGVFDMSEGGFQMVVNLPLIPSFGVAFLLGIDGISLFLVILSTFITLVGLIGLGEMKNIKHLIISILFLEMTMVGVFVSLDLLLFYLFWELSLVPMLYIIGAWGADKRIYAAVKFFLYTFAGSVLMLVGILYFGYLYHEVNGVWSFSLIDWESFALPYGVQLWLFGAFFLGFAIKVPMFPFHTWLPYAHGQAPTIGSVILAAVLLKMGTYGFVRFLLPLFPDATVQFLIPIAVVSVVMVIYAALIAFAQEDMKQVIAYSSISHMGVIILGTFALNVEGISGSVFFMISHGLVSGALFMLVGVIYDRRHTKMLREFGGIALVMPRYATIFIIVLMGAVGLPLTIGFVGEFLSLMGFYKINWLLTAFAGTGIILGAVYMLRLYRKTFFGELKKAANKKLQDLYPRELYALVPIVVLVVVLGVYPKAILYPLEKSVTNTLQIMSQNAQKYETKLFLEQAASKETK
ncbi:MAG: NADH-quinone oxidoreductase subunit M [Campylobacteraceae bacterium]|jgi:NADH-quinone oxidoreductase subunit M|nr:NADH-quinone oxidoreductase subunit M [Campylobacteraceae bacterium]